MRPSGMPALRVAAIALALATALVACHGPNRQVAGRWKSADASNPLVWEFLRNGNVLVGSEPGRYTFGDGNRMKIQTRSATFVHEVEFAHDRMIWKQSNGSKTEFVRAQ